MEKSDYIIVFLVVAVFLIPFLVAYYYDYKHNPKEFKTDLRKIAKLVFILILYFGLNKAWDLLKHFFE
jgi:ABC-type arginine transport system permease subunit